MTDGPSSSKCDLALITSVTPLRSSISWKRIDHKSPLGPCSRSPLCAMPLVTYFASIGIWMFDFSSIRLRILDSYPKLGCLAPGLPRNQYAATCRMCHSVVATRKWPLQMRPVSQIWEFRDCLLIRQMAIKTLTLALSWNPLLAHILTSEHSASSLAGYQSRGKRPRANKT